MPASDARKLPLPRGQGQLQDKSIKQARDLDMDLVDAQQARRMLDRGGTDK